MIDAMIGESDPVFALGTLSAFCLRETSTADGRVDLCTE